MPYIENKVDLGREIEVEKVFSGRYGKRCKHAEKKTPTPEEVAAVNERNAVKALRRLLVLNFGAGDHHTTWTYKGEEPTKKCAKKKLDNCIRKMRKWYRSQGEELKCIKVTEYMNKRIHHHVIVNNIPGCMQKLREVWEGGIYDKPMYEEGGFWELAKYLIKETRLTFKDPEAPSRLRYSPSRNLKRPVKVTKIIKAKEWVETPVPPRGYWVPKSSLVSGISEKTGRRYQYYSMVLLDSATTIFGEDEEFFKPRKEKQCRSG